MELLAAVVAKAMLEGKAKKVAMEVLEIMASREVKAELV